MPDKFNSPPGSLQNDMGKDTIYIHMGARLPLKQWISVIF